LKELEDFRYQMKEQAKEEEQSKKKATANTLLQDNNTLNLSELGYSDHLELIEEASASATTPSVNETQRVAYQIFNNRNPFIRDYDEKYYQNSKFHNWTETRFFSPG